MIDAHCHLEDMDEDVIKDAEEDMAAVVTSSGDPKDTEKTLALRDKYSNFVYVCLGFHAEVMDNYTDEQIEEYIGYIRVNKDKIVAIGEVGLDYNWTKKKEDQERSKQIFRKFIDLALELQKPLVIHARNGKDNTEGDDDGIKQTLDILVEKNAKNVMLHCYSGSEGQMKDAIRRGWMISIATVVCKSMKHQRLVKLIPLEQLLLETDAPWLDPDEPSGSSKLTNRPWKIEKSAAVIAEKMDITKEEVLHKTEANATRFFSIRDI